MDFQKLTLLILNKTIRFVPRFFFFYRYNLPGFDRQTTFRHSIASLSFFFFACFAHSWKFFSSSIFPFILKETFVRMHHQRQLKLNFFFTFAIFHFFFQKSEKKLAWLHQKKLTRTFKGRFKSQAWLFFALFNFVITKFFQPISNASWIF